jgi:hypothetical protein
MGIQFPWWESLEQASLINHWMSWLSLIFLSLSSIAGTIKFRKARKNYELANLLFSTALILLLVGVNTGIFSLLSQWRVDELSKNELQKGLKKVSQLQIEVDNKENKIAISQQKIDQLQIELEKTQKEAKEAEKRLAFTEKKADNTEQELISLREYREVATWNCLGGKEIGYGLASGSPVGSINRHVRQENDRTTIGCQTDDLTYYRETIEKYPMFPCTYYFLGACMKSKGIEGSDDILNEGIYHAKQTTKIAGHSISHDEILNRMRELLAR